MCLCVCVCVHLLSCVPLPLWVCLYVCELSAFTSISTLLQQCLYWVTRRRLFIYLFLFIAASARVCERVWAPCSVCWIDRSSLILTAGHFSNPGLNPQDGHVYRSTPCVCMCWAGASNTTLLTPARVALAAWTKSPWTDGWSMEAYMHAHKHTHTHERVSTHRLCVFLKASCQCCSHTPFITSY